MIDKNKYMTCDEITRRYSNRLILLDTDRSNYYNGYLFVIKVACDERENKLLKSELKMDTRKACIISPKFDDFMQRMMYTGIFHVG